MKLSNEGLPHDNFIFHPKLEFYCDGGCCSKMEMREVAPNACMNSLFIVVVLCFAILEPKWLEWLLFSSIGLCGAMMNMEVSRFGFFLFAMIASF